MLLSEYTVITSELGLETSSCAKYQHRSIKIARFQGSLIPVIDSGLHMAEA